MSKSKSTRRAHYLANREKILLRNKRYREANAERVREQKREEYRRHREAYLRRAAKWAAANPEKRREIIERHRPRQSKRQAEVNRVDPQKNRDKVKQWIKENPAKRRQQHARRRAMLLNATLGDPSEIAAFYEIVRTTPRMKCNWCGRVVRKRDRHVDHVIPLSRGGAHVITNLCCSCSKCNCSKHDKLPSEFTGQADLFESLNL
jgi:5-methylcytosine-specific restriction endonuclease McrA